MKKLIYVLMMVMFGMGIIVSCSEIENEDDNGTPTVRQVKKYIVSNFNKSKGRPESYWMTKTSRLYLEKTLVRSGNYYYDEVFFSKDGYYNGYPGVTKTYSTYKIVEENGEIHIYLNDFKYTHITISKCTKDELVYKWSYSQEVIDEVNRRKNEGKYSAYEYIEPINLKTTIYIIDLIDFVGGKAGEQSFEVYYYIRKDGSVNVLWDWSQYTGWYDEAYLVFEKRNDPYWN